jgi:hypothetical protein
MLETIVIILVVLWLLGLVSSYTMGGTHSHSFGHRSRDHTASYYSRSQSPIATLACGPCSGALDRK